MLGLFKSRSGSTNVFYGLGYGEHIRKKKDTREIVIYAEVTNKLAQTVLLRMASSLLQAAGVLLLTTGYEKFKEQFKPVDEHDDPLDQGASEMARTWEAATATAPVIRSPFDEMVDLCERTDIDFQTLTAESALMPSIKALYPDATASIVLESSPLHLVYNQDGKYLGEYTVKPPTPAGSGMPLDRVGLVGFLAKNKIIHGVHEPHAWGKDAPRLRDLYPEMRTYVTMHHDGRIWYWCFNQYERFLGIANETEGQEEPTPLVKMGAIFRDAKLPFDQSVFQRIHAQIKKTMPTAHKIVAAGRSSDVYMVFDEDEKFLGVTIRPFSDMELFKSFGLRVPSDQIEGYHKPHPFFEQYKDLWPTAYSIYQIKADHSDSHVAMVFDKDGKYLASGVI